MQITLPIYIWASGIGELGVPHDYLKLLDAIASTGRPVIFYDQLGSGNSDKAADSSLYCTTQYEAYKQAMQVRTYARTPYMVRAHIDAPLLMAVQRQVCVSPEVLSEFLSRIEVSAEA